MQDMSRPRGSQQQILNEKFYKLNQIALGLFIEYCTFNAKI